MPDIVTTTDVDYYRFGENLDGFSGFKVFGSGFSYGPSGLGFDVPISGTIDRIVIMNSGTAFVTIKNLPVSDAATIAVGMIGLGLDPDLDDILALIPGADIVAMQGGLAVGSDVSTGLRLFGKSGDDFIQGGGGPDEIFGGAGNDTLQAGNGDESASNTLYGGAGDDNLFGSVADDIVFGGAGNDTVIDTFGANTISTGAGDDIVNAGLGFSDEPLLIKDQEINLGGGNDQAYAGAGEDVIRGGAGNDTIDGGGGDDLIRAGNGDDVVQLSSGVDRVFGGNGADTFEFADIFLPGSDPETRSVIFDFDVSQDVMLATTPIFGTPLPELTLASFLEDSINTGNGVLWTSDDGSQVLIRDITQDDLTISNFADEFAIS